MSGEGEFVYSSATGVARFDFQIAACAHATGRVLNVGANEDPAQLRQRFGSKVINCDLMAYDHGMNRPNVVDSVFDLCVTPWPFDDDYADLVLFGDVLEHLPPEKIVEAMKEARRVGREMCITVPEDHRIDEPEARKNWKAGEYNEHTTILTDEVLRELLAQAGWKPYIFVGADWGFCDNPPTQGWMLVAHQI
jgi:hypothetical protein